MCQNCEHAKTNTRSTKFVQNHLHICIFRVSVSKRRNILFLIARKKLVYKRPQSLDLNVKQVCWLLCCLNHKNNRSTASLWWVWGWLLKSSVFRLIPLGTRMEDLPRAPLHASDKGLPSCGSFPYFWDRWGLSLSLEITIWDRWDGHLGFSNLTS